MFEDGSMWRPPQMNPYSKGMPDELVEGSSENAAEDHGGKKLALTDGCVCQSVNACIVGRQSTFR